MIYTYHDSYEPDSRFNQFLLASRPDMWRCCCSACFAVNSKKGAAAGRDDDWWQCDRFEILLPAVLMDVGPCTTKAVMASQLLRLSCQAVAVVAEGEQTRLFRRPALWIIQLHSPLLRRATPLHGGVLPAWGRQPDPEAARHTELTEN